MPAPPPDHEDDSAPTPEATPEEGVAEEVAGGGDAGRFRRPAAAVRCHPWRATAAVAVLVPLLTVALCWSWIRWSTRDAVSDVSSAPEAPVAIVLGAGLRTDGTPSRWLAGRLAAGAELYRQGKVQAILVSGDNSRGDYDEVTAMEDWLIAEGVPSERVVRDHAGFDTWDSCTRAKRIFGVDEALVVTQPFHLRRAVYLCREAGIATHGVSAPATGGKTTRNELREALASIKAVADGVLEPDPRYLGEREPGIDDALADAADG